MSNVQNNENKIHLLARELGFPLSNISDDAIVTWNISPGDDTLFAEISLNNDILNASICLNYLNRPTKVIGLSFDGNKKSISGVLKKRSNLNDIEDSEGCWKDAVLTFKSHLSSMSSGPFINHIKTHFDEVFDGSFNENSRAA